MNIHQNYEEEGRQEMSQDNPEQSQDHEESQSTKLTKKEKLKTFGIKEIEKSENGATISKEGKCEKCKPKSE